MARWASAAIRVILGIAHGFLPFAMLPLFVSIDWLDQNLVKAARDLYASGRGAFIHGTLPLTMPRRPLAISGERMRRVPMRAVPLILPAVVAGVMLAFALSFDDLVVTSFNYGVGSATLPTWVYSAIKFGVTPAAHNSH